MRSDSLRERNRPPGGHVVEVLGLVAAALLAVLQGAEMLGVGLRVVRCDVLEDVLRGSITAGSGVADGTPEEAHPGTGRESGPRRFLGLRLLRLFFVEEWLRGLLDVEFFRQAGDEPFLGEFLSALVIISGSEGEGVTVEQLAVGVVESCLVVREAPAFDGNAVHRHFDDAAVGPDGVGALPAVGAGDAHHEVGKFLADEVLDDVHTVQGLGEKIFLSHWAGPPGRCSVKDVPFPRA